jgi:threonyl-tRNA synthetase
MLQRIYATVFKSKQELKDYLNFLEEAKRRDHRKLGKDLDLFIFDKVAPGSPFFMPKGAAIYNELVNYMRRVYRPFNYKEVITPQVLDVELWHTSGHYENYKDDMFFTSAEKREFALKPMNCPCHMLMFKHFKYSYRDLPLRFADFGRLHRNEKSGTLAGLTRVRTFCQDDAHIFVPLNMIQDEIKQLIQMFTIVYRHFKFDDVKINLSTRPEKKVGDDKTWDIAENALKKALELGGHEFTIKEGDGAFYGPKIDFQVADALKRRHQLGTIQLDFQLPDRFDLKFVNTQGENERPVVLHRALLGSLERFFGVYLEHVAGAFPFWLAPEQAVLIPVKEDIHGAYTKELCGKLMKAGYRVKVDDRNESMNYKTREAQTSKIPYTLFIGDREIEGDSVGVRSYGENKTQTLKTAELFDLFAEKHKENTPEELR